MSVQSVTPTGQTITRAPAAAAPTATPPPAAGAATTTADPAAKKPGEVDIDPAQLRQWSTLSKAAREAKAEAETAKARVAELEAKAGAKPEVKTLAEARALGLPLEDLFAEWVQEGQNGGPAATTDAEARAKLKELEDRVTKDAEARAKESEAEKAARYEASKAEATRMFTDLMDEAEAPWKVAGRKENRVEAASEATKLVGAAVRRMGRPINDEEADKLMRMALDDVEADFVERGKRFSLPGTTETNGTAITPRTAPVARTTISNDRGTLRRPAAEPPKFQTFAEAKAELMAKLRSRKTT